MDFLRITRRDKRESQSTEFPPFDFLRFENDKYGDYK